MIEGKTKSGFNFAIDERVTTDQRLLDLIVDSESDDASVKIKATRQLYVFLLGQKGYEDLKTHVMKKNGGYCPADVISAEFIEIMQSSKELKNL